ncbi:MAG: type II secretion system protein [Candidatus Melainabacteria bacterium]|nr:type II secretion system protein [Candidatus Melainabacteria bacterium]
MKQQGFTLAELLIALAILGVIATFTVPKVLQSSTAHGFNAKAKETASAISALLLSKKNTGVINGNSSLALVMDEFQYVRKVTDGATQIDHVNSLGSLTCDASCPCYFLHNGAALWMCDSQNFAGTGANNAFFYILDPDGRYGGSTSGVSKSVCFVQYYQGRLTTMGELEGSMNNNWGTYWQQPTQTPEWFSWN